KGRQGHAGRFLSGSFASERNLRANATSPGDGLLRNAQRIAGAPERLDQLGGLATIDLGSKPADMRLDDVRLGIEMKIPDMFQKHGARHDASLVAHEIFQKL